MGGDSHLARGLAEQSSASCSDRAHQNADWTQLPEGPRLLMVQRMDNTTRAAWRTACKSTCQDVHAVTHTLTWRDLHKKQLIDVPQPLKAPPDSTILLPTSLIASLPNLLHLDCTDMFKLISIQGIPSTLRSLDLTWCYNLTSLAPLQHCTALQQLVLFADKENGESLTHTMPPVMSALSAHLRNLTLWFDCEGDESIAKVVVRSLEPLTRLQVLRLQYHHGDDTYWELLASVLGHMTDLRVLDLSQHECSGALSPLASTIRQLNQLQSLDLSGTNMDSNATAAVAAAIAALPPTLTQLKLGSADITLGSVPALTLALEAQSATLRSLDLSGRSLSATALTLLAPCLRHCTTLTDLKLWCRNADDNAASTLALVTALSGNVPHLTSLNLSNNYLGDDGAAALAPALASMSTLVRLDYRYNTLGPVGAAALAVALTSIASSLTALNIADNVLSNEGAAALAPALACMTALAEISCNRNNIGPAGAAALAPALLSIAPSLTHLDLSGNPLGDDGISALAPALLQMTTLTLLDCQSTKLGSTGAVGLASALPALRQLKHLNLTFNPLGFTGLRALTQGLQALSGQQRWYISCPNGLVMKDTRGAWALRDPDDAQELASIFGSLTCHHGWVLRASWHDALDRSGAAWKVSGLEVTLSC